LKVFKKSRENDGLRKDTAKYCKTYPSIVQKRTKTPFTRALPDPKNMQSR
jgi:hypothetical protein